VELNNDAVRDAIRNAKANDIKNIRFYNNDAGEFMRGMAEQREKADVVFMDPPRTGSTEAFMSAAVSMSPGRIIYISCEPETLARDLKWLTSHGYKAREAVAYDMFPFTENVETIVLMTKQS
jgi:23S rRNA (uracil1939-C5)-methyltransferase